MAQFTGADGVEYALRANMGALRRFEKHTGKKLLKVCFGSVRTLAGKSEDEIASTMFDGLTQVFDSMDDAARFIYECCVPRSQQAEMDFEKFCDDVLSPEALKDAVTAVFNALTEHLGATADAATLTGAGSDPKTAGG
jgi:hypothetical protein